MTVRHIAITGLFGAFDHEIPLFDPLTIIFGPNGVGKTSILRLLYGALRSAHSHLRSTPFGELTVTFGDGTALRLIPRDTETSADRRHRRLRSRKIEYQMIREGQVAEEYVDSGIQAERLEPRLDALLPFLHRVQGGVWLDSHTDTIIDLDQVLQLYGSDLPEHLRSPERPEWLREITRRAPVHFIETQRLLDTRPSRRPASLRPAAQSAVVRCAADFAEVVKSTLAQYATLSQSRDRTFPARVI